MIIETKNDLIEEILTTWKDRIGDDYLGYRGHVYGMFNFCLARHPCTDEETTKLAIAACFHDISLWSTRKAERRRAERRRRFRRSGWSSGRKAEPGMGSAGNA